MSDEKFHRELGDNYIQPCFQLTNEADRWAAKQRILERRFPEQNKKTSIMMQAPEGVLNIKYYIFFFT